MCDMMARTGRGTAVFVGEEEKPDQKLVGLLRAARGDIVDDISIDWGVGEDDPPEVDDKDFEMVPAPEYSPTPEKSVAPISLFDESHTVSTEKVDLGPQSVSVTLPPPH